MFYALKSKKTLEIAYYIRLFVRHLGVSEIFQGNNSQEFKFALLMFLKKYNIKLINSRPRLPHTQRLVERANVVVKDKLQKSQTVNGTGAWADALIKYVKQSTTKLMSLFQPESLLLSSCFDINQRFKTLV